MIGGIVTAGISEGIIALARYFSGKKAPAPRVQAPQVPVSRPADDMDNHGLAAAIRKGAGLPDAHQSAYDNALRDAIRAFNPEKAGAAGTLPRAAAKNVSAALSKAVCNAAGEVTTEALGNLVRSEAFKELSKGVFADTLRALLADRHTPATQLPALTSRLLENNPEFAAKLLACTSKAEADAVIAENMPAIEEAVQISAGNYVTSHALLHRDWSAMAPAARESVTSTFNGICTALRESFGKANVPEGATLLGLLSAESRTDIARQIRAGGEAVTPESLKEMVFAHFAKAKGRELLMVNIKKAFGQAPCPQQMQREVMESILKNFKGFADKLEGCRDIKSIGSLLAKKSALIKNQSALHIDMTREAGAAFDQAMNTLAARAGMTKEALTAVLNTAELKDAFAVVSKKIAFAAKPGTPAEMQAAFARAADAFVEAKTGLLASVDEMPLPDGVRLIWKTAALTSRSLNEAGMLQKAYQAAAAADTRSLVNALQNAENFAAGDIFGLMQSLAVRINDNLQQRYGAENWNALSKETQTELRGLAVKAVMSMTPALTEALAAHPALFNDFTVRNENSALVAGMMAADDESAATLAQAAETVREMLSGWPVSDADYNRQITAAVLNPGELPQEYVLALGEAAAGLDKNFGGNILPGGSVSNLLRAQSSVLHTSIGEQLAQQIRAFLRHALRGSSDRSRFALPAITLLQTRLRRKPSLSARRAIRRTSVRPFRSF